MGKKKKDDMISNLYKKPIKDKGVNAPKYPEFKDDYFHQADLLFLPNDDGYKYALTVVDVGSRKIDARALKSKKANDIIKAFKSIYSGDIIKPPTAVIGVDSGSEFKGDVEKYFKDTLNVAVKRAIPGRHRQVAIIERKNRDIGRKLFKIMTEEELITGEESTTWVESLPNVVKDINEYTEEKKTLKPKKEVKIENLKVLCKGDACKPLEQGTLVRVALDVPKNNVTGKRLDNKFRETDVRYDLKPRTVMKTLMSPGSPIMYLLDDGKGGTDYNTAYTKSQLQQIPANEKLKPAEQVVRGQKDKGVKKYVIEELLERKKVKNKIMFVVKWKGFKDTTLEPRSNLIKDVPDLVKEFEAK